MTTRNLIILILGSLLIYFYGLVDGVEKERKRVWEIKISEKKLDVLMKKYNLTINDLPAFPPKRANFKKLIISIGKTKKSVRKKIQKNETSNFN